MADPQFDDVNFVPHGSLCEADENVCGDVVKCGMSAVDTISDDDGISRYVCSRHLRLWVKQKRAR